MKQTQYSLIEQYGSSDMLYKFYRHGGSNRPCVPKVGCVPSPGYPSLDVDFFLGEEKVYSLVCWPLCLHPYQRIAFSACTMYPSRKTVTSPMVVASTILEREAVLSDLANDPAMFTRAYMQVNKANDTVKFQSLHPYKTGKAAGRPY